MADEPEGLVNVVGPDDPRETVMGQDAHAVKAAAHMLSALAARLGHELGYNEVGSALLSATVNYLLALYTPDSVREVLEGVLPNLQAMHDDLERAWLLQSVDRGNPQ